MYAHVDPGERLMAVTFQPADSASSDNSLTVRSFAPNMPIICHSVSARSTRAGTHSKTHHDIDQIAVDVRYAQVRQDGRVFSDERVVAVARVGEEHVADEELGVRARRGAQEAEHPMMGYT